MHGNIYMYTVSRGMPIDIGTTGFSVISVVNGLSMVVAGGRVWIVYISQ